MKFMKKMKLGIKLVIVFGLIGVFCCSCNVDKDKVVISGKLFDSKSKVVYLNIVDHFDYFNDGYVLDSAIVSKSGEFKFEKRMLRSKLISLTTKKFLPYTYQIYRVAPETYYFGNCAKFFTNIPTFYVSEESKINVNWYEYEEIDSISSPDNSGMNQVKLRNFYLDTRVVDKNDLNYFVKKDVDSIFKKMLAKRETDIKRLNLLKTSKESSFDNYLYTELYLGHLNDFLNWFEEFYPSQVEYSINNSNHESVYSDIFSEYNNHKWNSKSLEYFKFTERYVNYFMNIKKGSFRTYHLPSDEKKEVVNEVLKGKSKELYLRLINSQLNVN